MDELRNLEDWYQSQCNGDWEHQYGVRISNLDNPGWSLDVDLWDTPLADMTFAAREVERSESDWVHCRVEGAVFMGRGGVANLREMLQVFLDWARDSGNASVADPTEGTPPRISPESAGDPTQDKPRK
jgi:hypothetical protein